MHPSKDFIATSASVLPSVEAMGRRAMKTTQAGPSPSSAQHLLCLGERCSAARERQVATSTSVGFATRMVRVLYLLVEKPNFAVEVKSVRFYGK